MLTLTNTGAEHLSKEEENEVIEILNQYGEIPSFSLMLSRPERIEKIQRFLSNYQRMKERIKELEAENERLETELFK